MKTKDILFIAATAFSMQANAQWVQDSIDMNATYAKDVFYSCKNGTVKQQAANDWDIAFQMTTFGENSFSATVRANHIKKKVQVYSLHMQASTNFASLSPADTVGKTTPAMQLINIDTSWGEGAFTQNRDQSNVFDYGWGEYAGNPTHFVNGDSIYLVVVNNVPYKLWLQQYISTGDTVGYSFKIADFDGTNEDSVYIKRKPDYEKRLFAYYDITTRTVVDREPDRTDWDLLFTQYPKYLIFGPSGLQAYTGVLTNQDVEVAQLTNVDPDTMSASSYTSFLPLLDAQINVIGDDWKTFNMTTFMYELDSLTSFIIKSKNSQEYYQIQFTRFDGGTTGKTVFSKRLLGVIPSGVKNVTTPVTAFLVSPNPAANELNIVLDAKEKIDFAQLTITDVSGKTVKCIALNNVNGFNTFRLNTSEFVNGIYIISITNGKWKIAEKLIVQH